MNMNTSNNEVLPRRIIDERGRLIPRTQEQIRERNSEAIRALDDVAAMGDDTAEEQQESLEQLMRALGPERVISNRSLFP